MNLFSLFLFQTWDYDMIKDEWQAYPNKQWLAICMFRIDLAKSFCHDRYRGPPCQMNPCENGGVCQPFRNRFLCKCLASYTGKFCEKRKYFFTSCQKSEAPQTLHNTVHICQLMNIYWIIFFLELFSSSNDFIFVSSYIFTRFPRVRFLHIYSTAFDMKI